MADWRIHLNGWYWASYIPAGVAMILAAKGHYFWAFMAIGMVATFAENSGRYIERRAARHKEGSGE